MLDENNLGQARKLGNAIGGFDCVQVSISCWGEISLDEDNAYGMIEQIYSERVVGPRGMIEHLHERIAEVVAEVGFNPDAKLPLKPVSRAPGRNGHNGHKAKPTTKRAPAARGG